MTSEKEFVAFGLRSAAVWRGYFAGGVTPYQVSVDWGDGTITHYDTVGTERQSFAHAYDEQHSYTIRVTVKDKDGRQLTREYAAVSMTPSDEATGIGTTTVKLLFDSAPFMLALYALLFVIVLWLWRYEILHHGGKSYRALHYSWQKAYTGGKNRHHTPRNHA
jgi:hypothetical protein